MNACLIDTETECDLSLFVACYNEERDYSHARNGAVRLERGGCYYDIMVVDDASRDRSVPLIEQFMAENPEVADHAGGQ